MEHICGCFIANVNVRTYTVIRVRTIITTGDVTLRWRTLFAVVSAFPQVKWTSNERGSMQK